jgi:hypothetical protein
MPRFNVPVESDSPVQTKQALDAARIPTIGPPMAGYPRNQEIWIAGPRMTAVMDADSAAAAEAHALGVVGSDCQVGPAEPVVESEPGPPLMS